MGGWWGEACPWCPPLGQMGQKPLMAFMGSPLGAPPHPADTLALSPGYWVGDAAAVSLGTGATAPVPPRGAVRTAGGERASLASISRGIAF